MRKTNPNTNIAVGICSGLRKFFSIIHGAALAEKLRAIREGLGLSQTQMLKRLEHEKTMHYGRISEYESGKREPTLMTLLQYARVAGVHLEDIVDDELDLPSEAWDDDRCE